MREQKLFWTGSNHFLLNLEYTRKYPLRGCILGVLTHTIAWEQLWEGDGTLDQVSIYVAWLHFAQYHNVRSSVSPRLMDQAKGSEGDPDYIFFNLNTCQATFITDIL